MNWITKIYKHHKEWVAMVVSLGGGMYSEDIVSEAYIKLDKYNCEHKIIRKGKVSKGYMYFVLRSIFINYIKAKNKIRTVQIVNIEHIEQIQVEVENIKELKEVLSLGVKNILLDNFSIE